MSPHALAPDDVVATRADADPAAREPLVVLDELTAFLDEHDLAAGAGPPELTPLGDGHSNVTFALRRGDRELVLRRPPRGPLPPSAHDVIREARVVGALAGRARVPAVLAVEEDPARIGAPFYVMERVEGEVLADAMPPALDTPEHRGALGAELVDALAELHAVDWRAAGLEGFGKPTGYLELRRFGGLWEHNRTRDVPEVEEVLRWLAAELPPEQEATIVHGDYRLGNVLVAAQPPARVTAVLDWEMATIGDPLADVGYLCMSWSDRDDPQGPIELSPVTRQEGFPTRAELVARYEEASGRSMAAADWYLVLALLKTTVFMEGNYKRAVEGSSDDAYNRSFGDSVLALAQRAVEVTRASA